MGYAKQPETMSHQGGSGAGEGREEGRYGNPRPQLCPAGRIEEQSIHVVGPGVTVSGAGTTEKATRTPPAILLEEACPACLGSPIGLWLHTTGTK